MNVVAFNGSPRKKSNTAALLENALAGAASAGARTELVHLYDYKYTGCISCLACKLLEGKSYGHCAVRDALTPLLAKAAEADVLLLGSPIYLGTETGMMRNFMERLIYPYHTYAKTPSTLFPRTIRTAFIYTMGLPEDAAGKLGYDKLFERARYFMNRVFGHCELFFYTEARLFADPSKYFCPAIDVEARQEHHEQVFPKDCERAFALGKSLAS